MADTTPMIACQETLRQRIRCLRMNTDVMPGPHPKFICGTNPEKSKGYSLSSKWRQTACKAPPHARETSRHWLAMKGSTTKGVQCLSDQFSRVETQPESKTSSCGVEESYGDTQSSRGTKTKYRDHSYDGNHSRHTKKRRSSESPSSRISASSTSNEGRWKSKGKRHGTTDEDLAIPWTCEDFDELPPESIDGYKDLKAAFLAYFMQQKKYVKDPVEIHNIKQRDGETIEEFMERFKIKTGRMRGAPECMRISGFMHGVNNPELIKRLNDYVPKTLKEMMTAIAAFIRGETSAASKKKVHTLWKSHDEEYE
ncbi:reverse transcriptase domain-containing protein [Tanacetum coccineum]|uniref:Reverse transcriptase domain-containing protein n=1 Tax=Tanacetum coccineum TaxID=301880 RepID=A0ABQ4YHY3_9ASTR